MPEAKVAILQVEAKQTKTNLPMWTANTSIGKMSCFEKELADKLFTLIGKSVVVEYEISGAYKNLKKIVNEDSSASVPIQTAAQMTTDNKSQLKISNASYCLSYAKDLVVAGKVEYKDIKDAAINLLNIYEAMIDGEEKKIVPKNVRKELLILLKTNPEDNFDISLLPGQLKVALPEVNIELKKLLEEGIVFEPKPGFVKYLG
jgi:hypothetical protein